MTNFKADFAKVIENAKNRIDIVIKKAEIRVFESVIMKSPVDTGRFRGNWIATTGTPSFMYYDDLKDKPGRVTKAAARRVINESQIGGITYLVNNLPYAMKIEYGWSKQAPSGVVRTTVLDFQNYIKEAARF